jgi:hypothetical protein
MKLKWVSSCNTREVYNCLKCVTLLFLRNLLLKLKCTICSYVFLHSQRSCTLNKVKKLILFIITVSILSIITNLHCMHPVVYRNTKRVFYLPSTQQCFGRVFMCIITLLHVSVSWTIIRQITWNYKNHNLFLPVKIFIGEHCYTSITNI